MLSRVPVVLLVGFLVASVGGVLDCIVPEPCAIDESTSVPDGACPATCVRCNCCAQSVETALKPAEVSVPFVSRAIVVLVEFLPLAVPQDILHVPRSSVV